MVDSPFNHFYRLAEDEISNFENVVIRSNEINNDSHDTLSFDVNANADSIDLGTPLIYANDNNFDYYGGCEKCYEFSMLFGGVANNLGKINNDEEFEKYKTQFVEHYNKEHKDLYEWRKNKKGKKPITSEEGMERLRKRSPNMANNMSFEITGTNTITFMTDVGREAFGTPIIQSLAGMNIITSGHVRPEITEEDQIILNMIEAHGNINSEDKKRIEKKYGKSVIRDALGKYRHNLMTRRLTPRRGWRD